MQIVTGRGLLHDAVHVKGGVLHLVGEDSRRDYDARLAGILAHYHIEPAELDGRLHAVYLNEVDAEAYTLAGMIADLAVLNTHMLDWLRAFPDVVAVFVDPMVAWHRLIENDPRAMQILCSSLRAVAAQSRRAIAFDHHVTKIAMSDPEAHIHNYAALRGSSTIVSDARWIFTMSRLRRETAEEFGVPEEERTRYRRLDPLKASYGRDDGAPRLLKVESVPIANGEEAGVLIELDLEAARADATEREATAVQEQRAALAGALARMLAERCPRSASDAAAWLASREPGLFTDKSGDPASDRTIRRKLPAAIGDGLAVTRNGKPTRVVLTETGSGNGTRQVITFEQDSIQ